MKYCCNLNWMMACRRCLWVRQLVQQRVRHGHGGAELRAIHQRLRLRAVLPDPVRELTVVLQGVAVHHRHRHQSLPSQLGQGLQQRRLVQPAPHPLRHGQTRFHEDCPVESRHRPRHVPQVRTQKRLINTHLR